MDPVLVVGAGPVGLTAAAFLAHAGAPVRIIDANAAPTTLSKALVLWRRSLLTLAPLIPPGYWHSVGEPVLAACFADNGELAAQLQVPAPPGYTQQPHLNAAAAAAAPSASEASDAGDAAAGKDGQAAAAVPEQQQCGSVHALPAGMLVVQADIEGALVTLLRDSYGIEVQRNTSLAAFSVAEDSSSVLCTLTDTDGSNQQQLRASYLVGCDGGRSAVRKLLGVQFAGTTLDQRWLLGDFRYEVDAAVNAAHTPQHPCEGSLQRGTLFISPTDVGLMGLIPLGKRQGQVRVIWNADAHCPGEPTMQDFQQLLSTHTRQQMRLTEALWLSEFKINERQVQSYLHGNGRVLLAGDAAHIHSPAGGLGMNTGLQDAANLAWKLSLVAAGEAAAGWQLLDTYQEERHPVGAHVIRMSGLLLRANALRNPFVRFVRNSSNSSSSNGSSSNANGHDSSSSTTNGKKPYPKDEQECSKCVKEQRVDENLKPICGRDAEGLPQHHTSRRGVSNQVQLSTYADAIGDNLSDLTAFLQQDELQGAFGSLHLLPIYPSTGDRGFAPVTYQEVDPQMGNWDQVHSLGHEYQLCLEYMVNHISPGSPQFQDYLQHGEASRYASMFVKWRDIWPEGGPSADELEKVRTRKPAPPVLSVTLADGSCMPLWNTFSDQQVDINPFSEEGWAFTEASLRSLCEKGRARLIRLDAFGYVTKKAGTSCFMQSPEVWQLLERIKAVVKPYGVQLLCEVHEDFKLNIELARHGYWVYDFALPLLMLHALKFKTAEPLRHWLSICPRRQITTLDTHDGMGVDDVAGLAPLAAVPELERSIVCRGGSINYKHFYVPAAQFEADASCDDGGEQCRRSSDTLQQVSQFLQPDCLQGCYKSVPHQYNETYFSALGEDPQQYLLARAIQFFTPGVPMVYYVGLLAGVDDIELMKRGSIRDINRHHFSLEEAACCLQRPVVQALLELCRFRNRHPAFTGRVFVDDATPPHELHWLAYQHVKRRLLARAYPICASKQ
ncbi:hypothetical protein OEZ85_006776 [Tetradesmus obliquus]|uniref:FAD-binding domain-containing protein n=1 Tax=Tetradesmus obliquus TaxID=3088 RepID=A0ABY8TVM9_TETOB|nr:hypothetical protein OEZ85_006776 [Tetradesmus obliquus]